jgi:hypothetical protein
LRASEKSNHQRGYRCRKTIISIVAMNSPPAIPRPVVVILDITSPLSVITVTVSLAVAVSRARRTTIGIAQMSRNRVETLFRLSG